MRERPYYTTNRTQDTPVWSCHGEINILHHRTCLLSLESGLLNTFLLIPFIKKTYFVIGKWTINPPLLEASRDISFRHHVVWILLPPSIKAASGQLQGGVVYLWMPEHSMHSRTPRLMEAQPGSEWPQSQHWPLPGRHWILCRMVSPRSRRSRGSLAESMLLVDGEAVLSRRWDGRDRIWGSHSESFINL